MNRMLSQEEIDALLASAAAPTEDADPSPAPADVVAYDFRRPNRVSKEQIRSLHLLHDRFARNVTTSLSAFLRAMTEVSIVSAEQFAYSEFLASLPDPTAFYAVEMAPLEGLGALELNPSLAFTMVDRMLGGTGETPAPQRALTEIEQNVIDSIVKLIMDNLTETWRAAASVQFRIHGRETRPQMLQVTGLNETVMLLVFDMRIADTRGMLNICYPAGAIELVSELFEQGWHRTRQEPTAQEAAWLQANLGRVPLPVTATIESRLSARELLELRPGHVLAIGHPTGHPIRVKVGQVDRYGGHPVAADSRMGVVLDMTGPAPEVAGP